MPAGQPRLWATPEDLEKDVDAYLEHCKETGDIPMYVGFAVFKGTWKQRVTEYATGLYDTEDVKYSEPLKKLKGVAEYAKVQGLLKNELNAVGTIFILKRNYDGYEDPKDDKPPESNEGQSGGGINIFVN